MASTSIAVPQPQSLRPAGTLVRLVPAFLLTFAGVGLRTNIRELGKQGWCPFVVGAVGEVGIAVVTLAIVVLPDRFI